MSTIKPIVNLIRINQMCTLNNWVGHLACLAHHLTQQHLRRRPVYYAGGGIVASDIKANPVTVTQPDGTRLYGIEVFTQFDDLTVLRVMVNDNTFSSIARNVKVGEKTLTTFLISPTPIYNVTLYTSRGVHTQPIYADSRTWLNSLAPDHILIA